MTEKLHMCTNIEQIEVYQNKNKENEGMKWVLMYYINIKTSWEKR